MRVSGVAWPLDLPRFHRGIVMDEVEVGGHRIAYERKGDGPPLVLLHGWPMDGREWRRQVEGLSDEFTVVAWDAPGAGRSTDPPETFRLPDWADCLAAFIEALGLEGCHVGGLSWGGGSPWSSTVDIARLPGH